FFHGKSTTWKMHRFSGNLTFFHGKSTTWKMHRFSGNLTFFRGKSTAWKIHYFPESYRFSTEKQSGRKHLNQALSPAATPRIFLPNYPGFAALNPTLKTH
ncbi:MAG: hypothetical protein IKY07_09175, partial [Clostridia bacterium]|nr:hypothetical protein [Clostridia bacterium]